MSSLPGMPPQIRSDDVYGGAGAGDLSAEVRADPARVYVPNSLSNSVSVIDQSTFQVVATFPVGQAPQHISPSYDLRTLWVSSNGDSSLTPIDPRTTLPGPRVHVPDPYNLYFTPDGAHAVVVAESRQRLEFRDPQTMASQSDVKVPCPGVNHLDFSADGRYLLASCEYANRVIKLDTLSHKVLGTLDLPRPGGMPQDVRLAPSGRLFVVADMAAGGVYLIDGAALKVLGFVHTGPGAHGVYPSRDGKLVYVADRGSARAYGRAHGPGDVALLDVAAQRVVAVWPVPGGGSPDMGNVSADGAQLWLTGRFDHEVYVFDTKTGALDARIRVGSGPHGLTVWPLPGRYSLGHTGNLR